MDNILYASKIGATLTSDVRLGGGADDTRALQWALDTARERGHLRLVLDGAALISAPLRIHSNTTIVCPDKGCGLFLREGSNCCMLRNANWDVDQIHDENIQIFGGTFNHNALGQIHDHGEGNEAQVGNPVTSWVIGMEFYGVRGLTLRDVTICNQRTFTVLMANWENVTMENVHIDLQQYMSGNNQDGLHFFGPGRNLTLRNIYGKSGDDFIALAPDEVDLKSSITDVLIDGVTLLDADQGIRMLCRGAGMLDRVTVRHVTGTFGGFGFYINPWFASEGGHYGSILIEDVDLKPIAPAYDYRPPYLFSLGGNIDSIVFKDIRWHEADLGAQLFLLGGDYALDKPESDEKRTHIGDCIIDGLYIDEESPVLNEYIHVRSRVERLFVRNVTMRRSAKLTRRGALVAVNEKGSLGKLTLNNIDAENIAALVDATPETIGMRRERDVYID